MAQFSNLLSVMDRVPALVESLYLANSRVLCSSVAVGHSIARIAKVERGYLLRGEPAVYLTVSGRKVPVEFVQLLLTRGYRYYENVVTNDFSPLLPTLRGAVEIRQHDCTGSVSSHHEFNTTIASDQFTRAVIHYRAACKGLEVTIIRPAGVPLENSRGPKSRHASKITLESRVTILFSYPAVLIFGFGTLIESLSHHPSLQLGIRGVSLERCFYFPNVTTFQNQNGYLMVEGIPGRMTRMRLLSVNLRCVDNFLSVSPSIGMSEIPSDAVHVRQRYKKIQRFPKNVSSVRFTDCCFDYAILVLEMRE